MKKLIASLLEKVQLADALLDKVPHARFGDGVSAEASRACEAAHGVAACNVWRVRNLLEGIYRTHDDAEDVQEELAELLYMRVDRMEIYPWPGRCRNGPWRWWKWQVHVK